LVCCGKHVTSDPNSDTSRFLHHEESLGNQKIQDETNEQSIIRSSKSHPNDLNSGGEELNLISNSDEPILELISFPEHCMNWDFLGIVLQKFNHHLEKIHKAHHSGRRGSLVDHKLDQFASVVFKIPNCKKYRNSIWLLNIQSGLHQGVASLKEKFESLIKWMIFINTAVLRKLNQFESSQNELLSHSKILQWLHQEAFEPKNSFPVLGVIQNPEELKKGQEFGPIQKILIDYLSSGQLIGESLKTSMSIIELWYKEIQIDAWEQISSHGKVCSQETGLKSLIIDAINSGVKVYQGIYDHSDTGRTIFDKPDTLGEYEIPQLDKFPHSMHPRKLHNNLAEVETKMILKYIPDTTGFIKGDEILIKGLPVSMIEYIGKKGQSFYRTSLLDETGNVIGQKQFDKKLGSLIFHLKLCHKFLIKFFKIDKMPLM
jgi:hypothetical protein